MIAYILRRLAQFIPVLLLASLGIWAMIYAVPGSPIGALVGENATPEQIAAITIRLGLDQPILVQYWRWLLAALHGDLGHSIQSREPVLDLIATRIPATLQLVAVASALKPKSLLDRALSGWSALALGVPTFWLGILLILLFAVHLHWLPSASAYFPLISDPIPALTNLALPALTLGLYISGIFSRFLRAALLGELHADYVRTARSKGLRERDVIGRHVMRNAMLPFVTIVGLSLANFIGGTVITEAVFTYPGLGRLLIQAIGVRDYPLIQGCILFILAIYITINLLVDVLYAYIDPRIDYH